MQTRTVNSAAVILLTLSAAWQYGYEVPEPLAPTSAAECDAFQKNLEQRAQELNAQATAIHDRLYHSCADLRDSGEANKCWDRLHNGTYRENTECGSILYNFPQEERAPRFQAACAFMRARSLPKTCRDKVSAYLQAQAQKQQEEQKRQADEESRRQREEAERQQAQQKLRAQEEQKRQADEAQQKLRAQKEQTRQADEESHRQREEAEKQQAQQKLRAQEEQRRQANEQARRQREEAEKQQAQEKLRAQQSERERKVESDEALQEMTNPFGSSTNSTTTKESSEVAEIVDPFGSSKEAGSTTDGKELAMQDPFAKSYRSDKEIAKDKVKDIAADKASQLIEAKVTEEVSKLDAFLEKAQRTMTPSNFKVYRSDVEVTKAYLKGLSRVVEAAPFIKDAWEASDNWKEGWNDFAHDCESKGFGYVLKRLLPSASKLWEGPVGWAGSVFFDSSATQTPEQNLDALWAKDPSSYSFDQKVAVLQQLYILQAKHPEVWNNASDARRQWLYNLTLQVYNSPDNPNIHLTPP